MWNSLVAFNAMALPCWWGFLLSQKGVTSSILHDAACGSQRGHNRVAAQYIPDFSLWSLAIKVAELSKRNSKFLNSKCEFAPHKLWANHLLEFFISCYKLLFIYCMLQWLQAIFIILSATAGCFVIWRVWIMTGKTTKA